LGLELLRLQSEYLHQAERQVQVTRRFLEASEAEMAATLTVPRKQAGKAA